MSNTGLAAQSAVLGTIHKVEGFDPTAYAIDYTDLNTGSIVASCGDGSVCHGLPGGQLTDETKSVAVIEFRFHVCAMEQTLQQSDDLCFLILKGGGVDIDMQLLQEQLKFCVRKAKIFVNTMLDFLFCLGFAR